MIISVSFNDVIRLPAFNHLSIFTLLDKKNDSLVLPHCYTIGADVDKRYIVQACKHYTINKTPVVGYRYVFYERTDDVWLNGPYCSMSARIESQTDKHLAADMVRMSAEGLGWNGYKAMVMKAAGQDGMTNKASRRDIVEDYQETVSMIRALQAIQVGLRGNLLPDEDVLFDLEELAEFSAE